MSARDETPRARERVCSRCELPMVLEPWRDSEAWRCPCCKAVMRTGEMLHADAERRAAERGITVAELHAEYDAMIGKPTDRDMEQAVALVERMEKEWVPACEHDTDNPWAS